jgi:hypothetical protein
MSDEAGSAEPWWLRLIPDVRGWAMAGYFGLTYYLLKMIDDNPELLANSSFMQFAQALATGGVLLVATNLFGGTKSGAEAGAKTADALKAAMAASPPPGPPPATVTIEPPVTIQPGPPAPAPPAPIAPPDGDLGIPDPPPRG